MHQSTSNKLNAGSLDNLATTGLRFSPHIVLICAFLAFAVSSQFVCLRFAVYYVVTELSVLVFKLLSEKTLPEQVVYRPKGAGRCMGCGVNVERSCKCMNVDTSIGMPSGHSASLVMAATFWALWIWNQSEASKASKIVGIVTVSIIAATVVASRTHLYENCHTWTQVAAGSIIGGGLGVGFYYLDVKLQPLLKTLSAKLPMNNDQVNTDQVNTG